MKRKRNHPKKPSANFLASLLLFLVIIATAFLFFSRSGSPSIATTSVTTLTPPLTSVNVLAVKSSMINDTMMGNIYPAANLSYFSHTHVARLTHDANCLNTGAFDRNGSLYLISPESWSVYNSPKFDKNTPLEVYSNYYLFKTTNINILSVTPNCSYARALFNNTNVLNVTIVNVSNTMGTVSLFYKFSDYTRAGLIAASSNYNLTPSNVSFYALRFNYKNAMVTVGVYGFTNHINQTKIFEMAKLIQYKLLKNGA